MSDAATPQVVWRLPRLLERLQRPDFFFINIGANDGVSNDPIYPFMQRYGWRGIAVEPVPYIFEELRKNYRQFPRVAVEHAAIAATPRVLHFVPPEATPHDFVRQVGSLHPDYLEKTIHLMRAYQFRGPVEDDLEQRIQRIEVPCLTFDALLEKHRVQRVDFLNIDAEQNDFEILLDDRLHPLAAEHHLRGDVRVHRRAGDARQPTPAPRRLPVSRAVRHLLRGLRAERVRRALLERRR